MEDTINNNAVFNSFYEYLCDGYNVASLEMKKKTITYDSVWAWINHIPKPWNVGWDSKIYELSDKFLHELYNYSLDMQFIPPNYSFELFINKKVDGAK